MIDVTMVVLTMNEQVNIVDCLESVKGFARRVVVVDSGSTDDTVKLAKEHGAEVFFHEFEYYTQQFNWALDNTGIDTKWSFRLDADERLTPELIKELEQIAAEHADDDVNGVVMEAWLYFMGRRIKHGCRNKRKLMMFKTGIGRIEERKLDEYTVLSEGYTVVAKNRFIHYDFKNLDQWIKKMNWYATREVQDYVEYISGGKNEIVGNDPRLEKTRKRKFGFYYKVPMFLRSKLLFIYNYVFRLGFLDGREGYIYNYMYHRWYRSLVDAKIYEYMKDPKPFEKNTALK